MNQINFQKSFEQGQQELKQLETQLAGLQADAVKLEGAVQRKRGEQGLMLKLAQHQQAEIAEAKKAAEEKGKADELAAERKKAKANAKRSKTAKANAQANAKANGGTNRIASVLEKGKGNKVPTPAKAGK